MDDGPPPLTMPLSSVRGVCPKCGVPFVFAVRPDRAPSLTGQPFTCACEQVLGTYQRREAGMLWVRLCVDLTPNVT